MLVYWTDQLPRKRSRLETLTARRTLQGHVNNVNYFRYAESARVNWITNFALHADPAHRAQWSELMTPKSTGLIMRTLKSEFKFVRDGCIPFPTVQPQPDDD